MAPNILLIAHGSPGPQHAVTMRSVRDAVRAQGATCEVGFLDHDAPLLPAAVDTFAADDTVVAVPMLLNRAYHARVDIPSAVADAAAARPDLELRTAPALGPDQLLVQAMERRLLEAGVDLGGARSGSDTGEVRQSIGHEGPVVRGRRVGVVMVASGTSDETARADVVTTAEGWAERRGMVVGHAFVAGGAPSVAEAVATVRQAVGTDGLVVMAPYLFETGVLLARAVQAAEEAGTDVVAAPLRDAPEVVDLVLARARHESDPRQG